MSPKVVEQVGFTVVGIEARTNNSREMSGTGVIASQWARFMKENLLATIPGKSDAAILAVYSDYASNENGEYNFLIGVRAGSSAAVPPGMVARQVPGGRYAVFTSEVGPVEKVVVATWQRVWAATDIERAFKVDFEVYDVRARDLKNALVDLFIGIK